MGNIASYTTASGNKTSYTYDDQGQLISASGSNNYAYTYDGAGNLLTSNLDGTTHTYTYGDENWKDLLTAFDGQSITYDEIGNPLSYYNGTRWTFTWSNSKRLKTATNGTDTISYTYEADGQRVTKTVNDVEHTYYYSDGLLRRETYGDTTLDFFYDANGVPFSMLYNRSTLYYYITNLEGDVIKLVDTYGNTAAMYKYDPFGREIYAVGSHAQINPLRYRSYYYDAETEMYYVSSRYYDPEVGRMIGADIYISTGYGVSGYNMYAYCINNPVNYFDSTGRRPSAKLSLSDYYVIHKRIQIEVVYYYGYAMEVYVKGENGKGFLDLYDAKNHEFYEVTTQRQAGSDKKNDQMEKYEASIVHDWRFPEAEDMSSPTRGTSKKISGEFSYKNWDVEYKSNGEGYITYTTDFNEDRSRDKAAVIVTAFSIAGIGYMIPGGKVSWDVTCYMLM